MEAKVFNTLDSTAYLAQSINQTMLDEMEISLVRFFSLMMSLRIFLVSKVSHRNLIKIFFKNNHYSNFNFVLPRKRGSIETIHCRRAPQITLNMMMITMLFIEMVITYWYRFCGLVIVFPSFIFQLPIPSLSESAQQIINYFHKKRKSSCKNLCLNLILIFQKLRNDFIVLIMISANYSISFYLVGHKAKLSSTASKNIH